MSCSQGTQVWHSLLFVFKAGVPMEEPGHLGILRALGLFCLFWPMNPFSFGKTKPQGDCCGQVRRGESWAQHPKAVTPLSQGARGCHGCGRQQRHQWKNRVGAEVKSPEPPGQQATWLLPGWSLCLGEPQSAQPVYVFPTPYRVCSQSDGSTSAQDICRRKVF